MGASIFSAAWNRVADLRPRLRADVTLQRQMYRGEPWHLLVDGATGRQYRVNRAAYEMIGRFDGRTSVDRLWALLIEKLGEGAPTQDEVIGVVARLGKAGLVQLDAALDAEALRSGAGPRRQRRWVNPLAVSLPLFDPSRLLERLEPAARWLLHPLTLVVWALAVLGAAAMVSANWDILQAHAAKHMMSGYYLTLAWICYPAIKALHELAHALAVRRWGGEVHEMGITLLCFTPAPYVDASAANAFRDRWQRAAVSAAGIGVELALAAVAALVWLEVEPGTLRDVAFVTLFLCGASTLLFNANPLVRFDGYHLLCDVLDLPNLAVRSRAYWMHLALRLLGGTAQTPAQPSARGERLWLACYLPASFVYRVALGVGLALWLGSKSAWLGWLAALLVLALMIVVPAWSACRSLAGALPQGEPRRRAALVGAPAAACAAALVFAVPLPSTLVVQGVVWPPEQAQVRAETEGFVREVLARDGQAVEAGTPLIELAEPALRAEHESLAWRVQSLRAEQYRLLLSDPAQARNAVEELARVQAELERLEQRIGQLTVRAKAAGRLVLPRGDDLLGSFAQKGAMLGYVLDASPGLVRAVVPNESAPLVRAGTRRIEVLLPGRDTPVAARLERDLPAASQALPSAALGERGGGRHLTDPADKQGTRTLEPVFLFDVVLQGDALQSLGQRVWVRFALDAEPLGVQSYRHLRQLFLKHFNPVA